MSIASDEPVWIEILARDDCPSRGMAIAVVERWWPRRACHAHIEVVDVTSEQQARERRFLGSPTVRIEGRDVDQQLNGRTEFTLADRVYRTDRGLARVAGRGMGAGGAVLAVAQTTTNGSHESTSRSSATSP